MKALIVEALFTNQPNAKAAELAAMALLLRVKPTRVDLIIRKLRGEIKGKGADDASDPQVQLRLP